MLRGSSLFRRAAEALGVLLEPFDQEERREHAVLAAGVRVDRLPKSRTGRTTAPPGRQVSPPSTARDGPCQGLAGGCAKPGPARRESPRRRSLGRSLAHSRMRAGSLGGRAPDEAVLPPRDRGRAASRHLGATASVPSGETASAKAASGVSGRAGPPATSWTQDRHGLPGSRPGATTRRPSGSTNVALSSPSSSVEANSIPCPLMVVCSPGPLGRSRSSAGRSGCHTRSHFASGESAALSKGLDPSATRTAGAEPSIGLTYSD